MYSLRHESTLPLWEGQEVLLPKPPPTWGSQTVLTPYISVQQIKDISPLLLQVTSKPSSTTPTGQNNINRKIYNAVLTRNRTYCSSAYQLV